MLSSYEDPVDPPIRCTCGHFLDGHERHRVGLECVVCQCPGFRRTWPWRRPRRYPSRAKPY